MSVAEASSVGVSTITRRPPAMTQMRPILPPMDTLYVANLRASVAHRAGQQRTHLRPEKERLREHRWQRGQLGFMDRMFADVRNQRAYSEVSKLRENKGMRAELERLLQTDQRTRPAKDGKEMGPNPGPIVATYHRHAINSGYDQPYEWPALVELG